MDAPIDARLQAIQPNHWAEKPLVKQLGQLGRKTVIAIAEYPKITLALKAVTLGVLFTQFSFTGVAAAWVLLELVPAGLATLHYVNKRNAKLEYQSFIMRFALAWVGNLMAPISNNEALIPEGPRNVLNRSSLAMAAKDIIAGLKQDQFRPKVKKAE